MENLVCPFCTAEYEIRWFNGEPKGKLAAYLFCPKCGTNLYSLGIDRQNYYLFAVEKGEDVKGKKKKIPKYKLGPFCYCNEHAIVKESNYGKFWACANYPKGCKYTKKFRPKKIA